MGGDPGSSHDTLHMHTAFDVSKRNNPANLYSSSSYFATMKDGDGERLQVKVRTRLGTLDLSEVDCTQVTLPI